MAINKSILIFGTGQLQRSLIECCKSKGLYTVGIDPNPNAEYKKFVDAFEIVAGNDFDTTLAVAKKYEIAGVITAATDKPLVMMARIAKELSLPFFSVETAIISTDKLLMKQKFIEARIPCANGFVINDICELSEIEIGFPVIVKPRDNSGSRGVIYCTDIENTHNAVIEALQFTQKGNVLAEEYIEGKEYSVEGIHKNGQHHVVQITEKTTTDFPYNVELCHVQPADLTEERQNQIKELIKKVAQTLEFDNCASHTEIKINSEGIFVIETSPRLGGGFISSTLVPLSTGINMEDILIDISLNSYIPILKSSNCIRKYSGIIFFQLPEGFIIDTGNIEKIKTVRGYHSYQFSLKEGDKIPYIKNGIDRYGYTIFQADSKEDLVESFKKCKDILNQEITIESNGKD